MAAWLKCTGNYLLACWNQTTFTSDSDRQHLFLWITVIDKNSLEIIKKWCTEKKGFDCCYNERLEMIFSAYSGGEIIAWDLEGM